MFGVWENKEELNLERGEWGLSFCRCTHLLCDLCDHIPGPSVMGILVALLPLQG